MTLLMHLRQPHPLPRARALGHADGGQDRIRRHDDRFRDDEPHRPSAALRFVEENEPRAGRDELDPVQPATENIPELGRFHQWNGLEQLDCGHENSPHTFVTSWPQRYRGTRSNSKLHRGTSRYSPRARACDLPASYRDSGSNTFLSTLNSVRAFGREVSRRRGELLGLSRWQRRHALRRAVICKCRTEHLAEARHTQVSRVRPPRQAGVAPGPRDNSIHDNAQSCPGIGVVVRSSTRARGLILIDPRLLARDGRKTNRLGSFFTHWNPPWVDRRHGQSITGEFQNAGKHFHAVSR